MKKIYGFSLSALFLWVGLATLNAQYADGVLIANEGNFGGYNASVSYLDRQTQLLTNDIYNTVNNEDVGDVLQNIGVHGDKAYLVVNNSNKVIIVDRETFEQEAVITDHIAQPRYIAFANNKYYVTNSDSESQSVTVYDIDSNDFITEISIGSTVEHIKAIGNYLFVQDVWFGSGSTVSVIDATTDEVIETLEFESGVDGLDVDADYAYVISSGETYSHIYKIDGSSLDIVADVRTTTAVDGGKLSVSDDAVFFIANNSYVYGYNVDELTGEPIEVLSVANSSWSTFYGFNVINGFAYSSDANGFTAPSTITLYDVANGNELNNFTVGMGANGFYPSFDTLGTNEIANNVEISIYPNPVIEYVKINGVDSAELKVYNINGKLIKSMSYNGEQLNMSDLKSGLYFFAIATENTVITKKVLVK